MGNPPAFSGEHTVPQCEFFTDGSCRLPAYSSFVFVWQSFDGNVPMCQGHMEIIVDAYLTETYGDVLEDLPTMFLNTPAPCLN